MDFLWPRLHLRQHLHQLHLHHHLHLHLRPFLSSFRSMESFKPTKQVCF